MNNNNLILLKSKKDILFLSTTKEIKKVICLKLYIFILYN